jgi:hypothetical protein
MSITAIENRENLKNWWISINNLSENDKWEILKYLSWENYMQEWTIKTDSIPNAKDFFVKLNNLSNEEKQKTLDDLKEYFENKNKVNKDKEWLAELKDQKEEEKKTQQEQIDDLKAQLNETSENDKWGVLEYLSWENYMQEWTIKTDSIPNAKDFFVKLNNLSNEEKQKIKEYLELLIWGDKEAILSNNDIFTWSQRISGGNKQQEQLIMNTNQAKIDELNKRIDSEIKKWKKMESLVTTQEFKEELFYKYAWFEKSDLNLSNVEIVYNEKRNGIVINCNSLYEAKLGISKVWKENIIKNKEFIRSLEKIWLEILNTAGEFEKIQAEAIQEATNIDPELQKDIPLLQQKMKRIFKEQIKSKINRELSKEENTYLEDITSYGGEAFHYETDVIDGKYINIGVGKSIEIWWCHIINMQKTPLQEKMEEKGDPKFNEKTKGVDDNFTKTYNEVLDHEFQHCVTDDIRERILKEHQALNLQLPNNPFEAHLFISTKNELLSFLRNHYDKDWNIDFDKIEREITKELKWTHSYPWQFSNTNEKIMKIFTDRVHGYIEFIKERFAKAHPNNNGKYKPEIEFMKKLVKEFYTDTDKRLSVRLTNEEIETISQEGEKRIKKKLK